MRIERVRLLDAEKIEVKHAVRAHEVTEVFANRPRYRRLRRGRFRGEDVYAALGQTNGGRHLVVFFIHKRDGTALVLSGRDMERDERRSYARK